MTYHPALLATPVPRYTSYPTAADFHDRIGSADMAVALAAVAKDAPISLYVHIPFCRQICWYCGCNTGNVGRGDRLSTYLGRLRAEIAVVAAHRLWRRLAPFEARGLVRWRGSRVELAVTAMPYARSVAAVFSRAV